MNRCLGDELEEEALTRILQIKFNVVGNKIADYYRTIESDVDIPEFMKPKENQLRNIVKNHLLRIYYEGSLDYWYQRAMED